MCWQWWFVLMLVLVGILAMTVAVGPIYEAVGIFLCCN